MKKRIIAIAVMAIMVLSVFAFAGCQEVNPRDEVLSYINKLYEAKEVKFVVEKNVERSIEFDDGVDTSIQKYDKNSKLIYMYRKSIKRDTEEITSENLYQNGKSFDLINKKYQEVNFDQQYAFGSNIPAVGLLKMESTTFEKISVNEYFVVIDPRSLIGDMFGDMVFEYTIKIENNFISEIRSGSNINNNFYITTITRDIGELLIIDEAEFSK